MYFVNEKDNKVERKLYYLRYQFRQDLNAFYIIKTLEGVIYSRVLDYIITIYYEI